MYKNFISLHYADNILRRSYRKNGLVEKKLRNVKLSTKIIYDIVLKFRKLQEMSYVSY